MVAVSGRHSLVLGHPDSRAELERLARDVDAAVPRVSAVWGDRLVAAGRGAGAGRARPSWGASSTPAATSAPIAALALSGPVRGGTAPGGDRVLVNPPNMARLGRARPPGGAGPRGHARGVPRGDGAARAATGWRRGWPTTSATCGAGVPVRVAAGEVREELLAGRLPGALPADEAFDGDNADLGHGVRAGLARRGAPGAPLRRGPLPRALPRPRRGGAARTRRWRCGRRSRTSWT